MRCLRFIELSNILDQKMKEVFIMNNLRKCFITIICIFIMVLCSSTLIFAGTSQLQSPSAEVKTISNTMLKIQWSYMKGASGYQIYRSKTLKGGYKKIKTVKSPKVLSYIDKELKKQTRYYYKVRSYKAYKNRVYFAKVYDAKLGVTGAGKISTFRGGGSFEGDRIALIWETPQVVDGFELFKLSSRDGKYKKIATQKPQPAAPGELGQWHSWATYIDRNVALKGTYQYKVRTFVKTKERTYYSGFVNTTAKALYGIPYTQSTFDAKPGDEITEINMTLTNDPLDDTIRLNTQESVSHPFQKTNGAGGDYSRYNISEYSRDGVSYKKPAKTQISVKSGDTVWLKIKLKQPVSYPLDMNDTYGTLAIRFSYDNWCYPAIYTEGVYAPIPKEHFQDLEISVQSGKGQFNTENWQ